MSDEQWLRDGLSGAVPEPPTNPDRARMAESLARRRRRTATLTVVGTVAAVAALTVGGVTLTSGDRGTDREGSVASDPPPDVTCPPARAEDGTVAGSEIDRPDPAAPADVPEGAVVARLCQGPGTTFDPPAEALVSDVGELVDTINALEVAPEHSMCTMDLGPGFRIVLGYGDGATFVVSGQLYGCRTLTVGSGYRAGPEVAQDRFLELLERQQAEASATTEPPVAGEVVSCPEAPDFDHDGIDDVQGDLPDAVPAGATSVRLCSGGGNPGPAPADALVTDVDVLTDVVNALPREAAQACTDELGPGYRLAFGYPDGSTFVVVGRFYGCQTLVVGSDYRDDPQAPLDAFVELLRAQRATQAPPPDAPGAADLGCDAGAYGHPTEALADVADLTAAVLCVGGDKGTPTAAPLSDGDLATIVDDIATRAYPVDGVDRCYRPAPSISGVTAWGDRLAITYQCNVYVLPDGRAWEPGAAAQAIIDRVADAG